MKMNQKGIAPIIIALIVAIVLGGGYLIVKQQAKNSPKVENTTVSTNATSDWKTYKNEKYGFEIKYPNSFIGSVSEKAKLAGVLFYGENSEKLDLEGSFNDNLNLNSLVSDNKNVSFKKSEILVDGVKSYKVDSTTCYMGCGSSYNVFSPYKNGAIIIGIRRGNGSEKDPSLVKITDKEKSSFDEIISTFKFIAPATTTIDWKTYTNTKYGFSIQYPVGSQINDGLDSNSPGISFKLPTSGVTSHVFYVYVATKAWYNLGTPNGIFRSPANCEDFNSNTTSSIKINGVDFIKGDVSEAATAQRSNATEYCVLKGEIAYKLTPSIQYGRNDATSDGFDPAVDVNNDTVLNQMLSTFKFTTPTAVQLPKAISSIVENKLSVWVTQWKKVTPNFNLASFSKENESTISSAYERNPCDAKCSNIYEDMKNLYAFSPNGEKFIDVHGGQMIEVKNGKHVFVPGEPDSSVLVVDKKLQTIQTVLFCGTPCGFSNAAWVDNNSLVVVGGESISDTEGINYKGQVATLYVINLATQKVELYKWPTTAEQVQ